MIDLKKYCEHNSLRDITREPFTIGEYSYATNGHIMVRIPKIHSVPEKKLKENVGNVWNNFKADDLRSFSVSIPEIKEPESSVKECDVCKGTGECDCDCKKCDGVCEECDGDGEWEQTEKIKPIYIKVGENILNAKYLKLIQDLPNAKISIDESDCVSFTFDGGEGIIMGVRNIAKPDLDADIGEKI